ncbi:MAG: hypothetical protein PVH85_21780 [Desulfobacterales bacterium]|jgi:hypothetical protein
MKAQYYVIGDIADIDLLKSQLSQSFTTIHETKANTTFEASDSFDWRLYHKLKRPKTPLFDVGQ